MDTAIEVRQLVKTYAGDVRAVRDISFDVHRGEVFGLLGPNGAGKSTTVGMLTTTVAPSSGAARLAGFDVVRSPLEARSVSSVVFQEAVVDRALTGRSHLDIHARLWRVAPSEAGDRIARLSETLGLADLLDRPVGTTAGASGGGSRSRGRSCRAPACSSSTSPRSASTRGCGAELLDLIAGLRDRLETTILLTTHYLDEAERLCDRLAIMHEGKIVALDTPHALRADLGEKIVELRVRDQPAAALDRLRDSGLAGRDAFAVGTTITIPLHDHDDTVATAEIERSGIAPTAITTREPTLDDVYLRLTGGQLRDAA